MEYQNSGPSGTLNFFYHKDHKCLYEDYGNLWESTASIGILRKVPRFLLHILEGFFYSLFY